MRAAAPLAFALRSFEADHGRKLGPVDGVKPSIAGMDRHQVLTCVWGMCRTTWATSSHSRHLLGLVFPRGLGMVRAACSRTARSVIGPRLVATSGHAVNEDHARAHFLAVVNSQSSGSR